MSQLPLPAGKRQIVDVNGAPLVGGTVAYYYPGGLVPRTTYQDYAGTEPNDNPLVLDELGSAAIWGTGRYREIVLDADGNLIWDRETAVGETASSANLQAYAFLNFFYEGDGSPVASELIGGWSTPLGADFPAAMLGSTFQCLVNPSASYEFGIYKAATLVATLTVGTGGTFTYATTGGAWSLAANEYATIKASATPDAALNQFFGTLVGTYS